MKIQPGCWRGRAGAGTAHEIGIRLFVEPATAHDELFAEIPYVSERRSIITASILSKDAYPLPRASMASSDYAPAPSISLSNLAIDIRNRNSHLDFRALGNIRFSSQRPHTICPSRDSSALLFLRLGKPDVAGNEVLSELSPNRNRGGDSPTSSSCSACVGAFSLAWTAAGAVRGM